MTVAVPRARLSTCATVWPCMFLKTSYMKAAEMCFSSSAGCHTTASESFYPQLPPERPRQEALNLRVRLFLLTLVCRFWPGSLRGAWSPQLRLQDPGRRPLRQHLCPVLLQPWIQPSWQQHLDLPQWGQASVGQAPPFLCGWVGRLKAHQ